MTDETADDIPGLSEAEKAAEAERQLALDVAGFTSTPATFTNRFYAAAGKDVTRVAFGEKMLETTLYHSAIHIPSDDAWELAVLLVKLIAKVRGQSVAIEVTGGGSVEAVTDGT